MVMGAPTSTTVTLSTSPWAGTTITSSAGTNTASVLFRNVKELACLELPALPTVCPSGNAIYNALPNMMAIEVTDDDLQSTPALEAAYYGGQDGFSGLLRYANHNSLSLAIAIGAPVSYNATSCLGTVTSDTPLNTYGSATVDEIHGVVSALATAVSQLGTYGPLKQTTIKLDLDEPLNAGYDSFVGNTQFACSIGTLASLASSILAQYQQQWEMQRHNNGALPEIKFFVGGDEAPAAVYNSPTFAGGTANSDPECSGEATKNQGEEACFLAKFHEAAQNQAYSVNGTAYMLSPDQQYYNFLLMDIGTTQNDWQTQCQMIFDQVAGASLATLPTPGYIFAVLNDKGPTAVLTNGGSTGKKCPQRAYWSDNSFCVADNAAIAAAQVKVQDILTLAQTNADLEPGIIRISSYDKSSPSHLLPDTDPASLTSFINWLFSGPAQNGPAQGAPPNTLFQLYQNQNVATGSEYLFTTNLEEVEQKIGPASSPWRAHYPPGELPQQQTVSTIGTGITLMAVQRYLCNEGTPYVSDFLQVGDPITMTNCTWQESVGYAHPYDPNNPDPCTLFDINNVALPYSNNCPNAADIPLWQFTRTNVNGSGYNQYYYTLNPKQDTTLTGVWPGPGTPVFYVQPNLPRYPAHVPMGFQGGLLTSWAPGLGAATTLTFFDGPSMTFGFQEYMNSSNVLAVKSDSLNFFSQLICGGMSSEGVDCPSPEHGNPFQCQPPPLSFPGLSCNSQQNAGITQFSYGNPSSSSTDGACCAASMATAVVAQDPIMNFFLQSPFVGTYANDNTYMGPNGQH